ncbi:MAG TPA: zinc-ribbon domain-containing protein, partial [Myxococcaceae bacterium]|nr:zinc-ribbon domain-containing protein [Myxococcaceae bacterium]
MDVRCEQCGTEYEFDDDRITEDGVTVRCTTCRHVFAVKKTTAQAGAPVAAEVEDPAAAVQPGAVSPGGERSREWKVRQASGHVFAFKEIATLQKWIVERKVKRDDQISLTGESWKRLGDIGQLAAFFQVV